MCINILSPSLPSFQISLSSNSLLFLTPFPYFPGKCSRRGDGLVLDHGATASSGIMRDYAGETL